MLHTTLLSFNSHLSSGVAVMLTSGGEAEMRRNSRNGIQMQGALVFKTRLLIFLGSVFFLQRRNILAARSTNHQERMREVYIFEAKPQK